MLSGNIQNLKVAIIGDCDVGKTCLQNTLMRKPNNQYYKTTCINVESCPIKIPGYDELIVRLCDTPGLDSQSMLITNYVKSVQAVILMLKTYWISEVIGLDVLKNKYVVLLGNIRDGYDCQTKQNHVQQFIDFYADDFGILFEFQMKANNKKDVEQMINQLAQQIIGPSNSSVILQSIKERICNCNIF